MTNNQWEDPEFRVLQDQKGSAMTDETTTDETTTDETCPNCGKVHAQVDPKTKELVTRLEGFDEERRFLLLDKILSGVSTGLRDIAERVPAHIMPDLAIVANLVNLAGYTQSTIVADHHEEWDRTGDRKVDAFLDDYLDNLEHISEGAKVTAEDLGEERAARMLSGEATEEDYVFIRDLVKDRTGVDPGDLKGQGLLRMPERVEASADGYVPPEHDTLYL